jgi:hypothetical protein
MPAIRMSRWGLVGASVLALVVAGAGSAAATTQARGGLVVSTGALVLAHDGAHYGGSMRVTVRNRDSQPVVSATMVLAMPAGLRFVGGDVFGCGGVNPTSCGLPFELGPHQQRSFTLNFGSSAAPASRARITGEGTVTVHGTTGRLSDSARYAGVLRASDGSLRRPVPYRPSTDYDLALSLGEASVERGETGEYSVRVPVTVVDRTDAENQAAFVRITPPAGGGFPGVDPPAPCTSVCEVAGGWMASGESRSFAAVFTMPVDTAPGSYPVTVSGFLTTGFGQPTVDLTPLDNTATTTLVIAG